MPLKVFLRSRFDGYIIYVKIIEKPSTEHASGDHFVISCQMLIRTAHSAINRRVSDNGLPCSRDGIHNLNPLKIVTQIKFSRCFCPRDKVTIVIKQVRKVNLVNRSKKQWGDWRIVNLDKPIEKQSLRQNSMHTCGG